MKTKSLALTLLLELAGFVWGADPRVPYGNNPAAGKYYDVRGIKMYCEIYGQGEPLLLIHGNNGNITAFRQTIPFFAAKYRVIAPDSRAQGKSEDAGAELSFEMMADDFAALLDVLRVRSAYVIGWSDGGINALLLAKRHPEKVIKLASTGANLWPDASAFAPGAWEDFKKHFDENHDRVWKTAKERNGWKLFMLDWSQPHIALEDLKSVRSPALIICGDHDVISIEHTVQIYRSLPRAALWVVPQSGHATLIDQRDEFNRVVDRFFAQPFRDLK